MNPPWSMVIFTLLAGAAQGLMLALAAIDALAAVGVLEASAALRSTGAVLVLGACGVALVAATFHLGHPLRAWRAAAMWRTSWLSREVIVLPLFMAAVAAWAVLHWVQGPAGPTALALTLALTAAALALLLYLCTGMIYAAVKAMRAWAHPITPLNFALIGGASGVALAALLAAALAPGLTAGLARGAMTLTLLAAAARGYALQRALTLPPRTTLQTAIGVRHPRIVQISQGSMGGTFNTREFRHRHGSDRLRSLRWVAAALGFALPAALFAAADAAAGNAAGAEALLVTPLLGTACAAQALGLLAERMSFFTEADHPQNLYQRGLG